MAENKSPFEEIFKKEEEEKEAKEKKEEGLLGQLDEEQNTLEESFEENTDTEEKDVNEKQNYLNLINNLLQKEFYKEAISTINEMKEKKLQ